MNFKDQLGFVFSHMKKNKLRVAMTTLATTIGCAFLIILVSVGFGMQKVIEDEFLNQDSINQIQFWGDVSAFGDAERKEVEGMENVKAVKMDEQISDFLEVYFEDRKAEPYSIIIDIKAAKKLDSKLSEGRLPVEANEIVVGYDFAQSLLNEEDRKIIEEKEQEAESKGTWYDGSEEGYKGSLLGKEVEIVLPINSEGEKTVPAKFKVVGVGEKMSYEWSKDESVTFSEKVIEKFGGIVVIPSAPVIYVDSVEDVMAVLQELKDKDFEVYSPLEQIDEIDKVFLFVKAALIFVGTIAVLIASIGIFNTMTMAVTERTREIGVLKAIGASPKLIQRLFLMESAFIGILGTVLAVILSYGVSFVVNLVAPLLMGAAFESDSSSLSGMTFSYIPLSLVVIAIAISLSVAILSGWRPARKATKIEVVQALRQEL